ncbi:hypothetical protein GWI33_005697 [Rhynchophorus ferrugineus]|uniref:Uncharacterized protein n=1 Tax=Rhynchophorus ferrugineus TaxID=354439 RepID=A0A834IK33_RHYFE|nr:hypothetical protein GWI33_005697 [Rhynchophorus ferrugineus]
MSTFEILRRQKKKTLQDEIKIENRTWSISVPHIYLAPTSHFNKRPAAFDPRQNLKHPGVSLSTAGDVYFFSLSAHPRPPHLRATRRRGRTGVATPSAVSVRVAATLPSRRSKDYRPPCPTFIVRGQIARCYLKTTLLRGRAGGGKG